MQQHTIFEVSFWETQSFVWKALFFFFLKFLREKEIVMKWVPLTTMYAVSTVAALHVVVCGTLFLFVINFLPHTVEGKFWLS